MQRLYSLRWDEDAQNLLYHGFKAYGEDKANMILCLDASAASACATASYKLDAVTSTVCDMPSISRMVTRQDRTSRYDWVAGLPQGPAVVKVSVVQARIDHEVKMADFERWLEKTGGSPREVIDRKRIRV
jgi:hypothetical protein